MYLEWVFHISFIFFSSYKLTVFIYFRSWDSGTGFPESPWRGYKFDRRIPTQARGLWDPRQCALWVWQRRRIHSQCCGPSESISHRNRLARLWNRAKNDSWQRQWICYTPFTHSGHSSAKRNPELVLLNWHLVFCCVWMLSCVVTCRRSVIMQVDFE